MFNYQYVSSLLLLGSIVLMESCQPATDNLNPENTRTDANSRVVVSVESYEVRFDEVCYNGNCRGNEALPSGPSAQALSYSLADEGQSDWNYSIVTQSGPTPTATSKNGKSTGPSSKTIAAGLGNVIIQLTDVGETGNCPKFGNVVAAYIEVEGGEGPILIPNANTAGGEYNGPSFTTSSYSGTTYSGSDGKGTGCNATGDFIKFENLPDNITGMGYILDQRFFVDYGPNKVWIKTGRVTGTKDKCQEYTVYAGPGCGTF